MLEPKFTPPDKNTSKEETKKRNDLIKWFVNYIDPAITAMIVSGSMSYGENYSVKPTSDIDMQLVVTTNTVNELKNLDCFDKKELEKAISGYLKGVYSQFSLVFERNGVNMECHFWDEKALIDAITYKTSETKRLRSGIEKPSTDHGFSFARDESVKDYFGEIIDGFAVGIFPSYRIENSTIYLCRPITNILGLPRFEKTNQAFDGAVEQCWQTTVDKLAEHANNNELDLNIFSVANTLPGKNKMTDESLLGVNTRTVELLEAKGIKLKKEIR